MAYENCPKCGTNKHKVLKCKSCGFSRSTDDPSSYSKYYTDTHEYWLERKDKDPLDKAATGGGFEQNRRKH